MREVGDSPTGGADDNHDDAGGQMRSVKARPIHTIGVSMALICGVLWIGSAAHPRAAETAPVAGETDSQSGVRYKVVMTGAPGHVKDALKDVSELEILKKRLPRSLPALYRRAAADVGQFRDVLESEGYYDATVDSEITASAPAATVHISVVPGQRYKVADIALDFGDQIIPSLSVIVASKAFERPLRHMRGRAARAADVIAAEDSAIGALRDHGFPQATRGDRDLRIDRTAHTIAVTLPIKIGPEAVFGVTRVSGLDHLHESFVTGFVPWKAGERFDYSRLDKLRTKLVESGLFGVVKVAPAAHLDADGKALDVIVEVKEGARRTIALGATYDRDKGIGGSASWTHRNLFGGGEKLDLTLAVDKLDQTATAALTKPHFLRPDQTLKTHIQGKHSSTDAYRQWSGEIGADIERELANDWIVGVGTDLEVADIEQEGVSLRSTLVGLPITAIKSDPLKLLDQTRGWRFNATVTPYAGSYTRAISFLATEVEADAYLPLGERARTVFAGRLKLGSIVGAGTADIPADKRFYAGGGGSIRGFGYQKVGPLDATGAPTGGRSLMEAGLEARFKITNTIGIVPFIDAGGVSESSMPMKGTRFAIGAGIGARYYTGLGPLRLDVAFPVNPRRGIDSAFQFYISFGQAF